MANFLAQYASSHETTTENGMKAYTGTNDPSVDFFSQIGSMRGLDPIPLFSRAAAVNPGEALRIALWLRDVRGGAGERDLFRKILLHLEATVDTHLFYLLPKIPEIGRWDDLLIFQTPGVQNEAFSIIRDALRAGNGLCAKWMPRKGPSAARLRSFLGMSPKGYRKYLVELTNVVETQMCAGEWSEIEYPKVPSQATRIYSKAFLKHDRNRYSEFTAKAARGEVKINAGAIYPYQIIAPIAEELVGEVTSLSAQEMQRIEAQWKNLPDFISNTHLNILPIVDVSGSMYSGTSKIAPISVAVSLGLYLAERQRGQFQDTFVTFSERPEVVHLAGDSVVTKLKQITGSSWGMNTNINAVFDLVLDLAKESRVSEKDMPNTIIIFSDMQFDCAVAGGLFNASAVELIRNRYAAAGYDVPKLVFWDLNGGKGNLPIQDSKVPGVMLVSGFSPSLMTSILGGKVSTPREAMEAVIFQERYDL